MISTEHALRITSEPDQEKREAMIDALSEEDAKYMLKIWLRTLKKEFSPNF